MKKSHICELATIRLDKERKGFTLLLLDKTLFSKWCWRFASKRESLWMWVIIEKIEEEMGGWCSCVVKDVFGMGM